MVMYQNDPILDRTSKAHALYKTIHDGGCPSVTDIYNLREMEKVALPVLLSQLARTLKGFGILLATLLKERHPLVRRYERGMLGDAWDAVSDKIEQLQLKHPKEPIYAEVLRWIQIRINNYWREIALDGPETAKIPNFGALYNEHCDTWQGMYEQ